jgi:asparagine synthetase B (glutamine-hydrolysing)
MCGFLISKNGNSKFISPRGQDGHGMVKRGLKFEHFLLNITGEPTLQPFIQDDIYCVYNGEIYNKKFKKSDGENLIPLYKEYGIKMVEHLEGEYAIAIYDFKNDKAVFITDLFATKPIWRNGIECASYESGVGGHKIRANSIEVVEISTGKEIIIHPYHQWDFTQFKDNYDDCLVALVNAVRKRYKPGCFIGLSSGHDSGTIASILKGKDFKCYTIIASEDRNVINERAKLVPTEIIEDFDIRLEEEHLNQAEEFLYKINYDSGFYGESYKKDYASKALSHICRKANSEDRKVYLSGMGADELVADYSAIPNQSEFKGKFPDELKEWKNFYDNCMYSYLGKEECVGGSWNIETRYPFLDKDFVQEFLWLKPELKNAKYKSVITEYLERSGFPFHRKKIGFSV